MGQNVHGVVELGGARMERDGDPVGKVGGGALLRVADEHALAQPVDILGPLKLGNARREHELEEVDELVRVRTDDVVRPAAQVTEARVVVRALLSKHIRKVGREHEGGALTPDAKLGLEVAQKVAKVDVEEVACACEHDVVIMPVADAHDIRGNAVARERD